MRTWSVVVHGAAALARSLTRCAARAASSAPARGRSAGAGSGGGGPGGAGGVEGDEVRRKQIFREQDRVLRQVVGAAGRKPGKNPQHLIVEIAQVGDALRHALVADRAQRRRGGTGGLAP